MMKTSVEMNALIVPKINAKRNIKIKFCEIMIIGF